MARVTAMIPGVLIEELGTGALTGSLGGVEVVSVLTARAENIGAVESAVLTVLCCWTFVTLSVGIAGVVAFRTGGYTHFE